MDTPKRFLHVRGSCWRGVAWVLGVCLVSALFVLLPERPHSDKTIQVCSLVATTWLMALAWGLHSARWLGVSDCGVVVRRWGRTERIRWQELDSVVLEESMHMLTLQLKSRRFHVMGQCFPGRAWWSVCDAIVARFEDQSGDAGQMRSRR